MPDTKLADLTALTTPSGDDLLYVVDDPAGTPADRKLALDNLFTRGTVTTSQPVIDASQTWNNAAVTFTGLKFNVPTDTSAAGSLLMDLQVGGSSRFRVSKAGVVEAPRSYYATDTILLLGYGSSPAAALTASNAAVTFKLGPSASFGFNTSSTLTGGDVDTAITRRGERNLRLGFADAATPLAQTLSVQSATATGADVAGANFTITGSQGRGGGDGGSIIFQVAPAGTAGNGAVNGLVDALTIAGDRNVSLVGLLRGANSFYSAIDLGGTSGGIPVGIAFYYGSAAHSPGSALAGYFSNAYAGNIPGLYLCDSFGFTTRSGRTTANTPDIRLFRDAAGILAQRNGVNPQAFLLYNTWTSFGSGTEVWERGKFAWESNVLRIGTEKGANGGAARALEFQTDGTTRLTIASTGTATFAGNISGPSGFTITSASNLDLTAGSSSLRFSGGFYPIVTNTVDLGFSGGGFSFKGVYAVGPFRFDNSGTLSSGLYLDAANIVGLRNGTNNQELRVYGSYTSASVYDRLTLKSSSTVATIAAETDAGDMDLALTPAGSGNVQFGTHAAVGAETITGYITIKDAGGTLRKLAVIS